MQLLERERCLADLGQWLSAAADGGCIVLISGEAGVGKTSLLQAFCTSLKARVLWGSCDALFTPRPLAPLYDIARQARGQLLAALDAGASRDRIFNTLLNELEQAPPCVLVFEDLHWGDEATLDLMKFLGRRIQRTRTLLAATYRDDEVDSRHPLRFVIGDLPRTCVRRLNLAPLSEESVNQLASRAGRPAGQLYGITGGNPLFVTEALAAPEGSIPVTVKDAVLARAARLSDAARRIAEIVCVIPGKAEAWLLESTVDPQEAAIESCLATGMVRDAEGSLAFRHELARRAFEDSLPMARRLELHARVLEVLAARASVPAARLAHHAAGAQKDADVVRFAPLAGEQAASVGAHREAAAQFRLAVRHAAGLAPAELAMLEERRSYECYLTDRMDEAIEARLSALSIWRSAGDRRKEGDSLRWASRLSWFAGRGAEALRYAAEAVDTLQLLAPGPELAMAYSNQAQLFMLAHDAPPAIEWAQRTIRLAEKLGNREILCHALNNLGTSRVLSGDAAGWEELERSLEIARSDNYPEHAARAYTNLGSSAVMQRDYARASKWLNEGIAYCVERDLDSWRIYMLAFLARAGFELGDWHAASRDAEAVLANPATAPISRITALTILGHLRIRRGDPDAQSPLEQARALASATRESQRIGPLADAFAERAWLESDQATVVSEISTVFEWVRHRPDPWMKGALAAWLWRVGSLSEVPADVAPPYALEMAGKWQAAAREWHSRGCPYEQACMLGWYGDESAQREALRMFEHLGAAAAAQALRRLMKSQGVTRIPRGSRTSTRTDPHGLTRRELQILELLGEGLRNASIAKRLFLSTKTVDHHVSSILTKLGAQSRSQAIAILKKRGGA